MKQKINKKEQNIIDNIIKKEKPITDWAVALQKKSRLKSNRFEELKKIMK